MFYEGFPVDPATTAAISEENRIFFEAHPRRRYRLRELQPSEIVDAGDTEPGLKYYFIIFEIEPGVRCGVSITSFKRHVDNERTARRLFSRMRKMLLTHKDLLIEMEKIRKKVSSQDEKIELIFDYLKQFIKDQKKPRKQIGFKPGKGKK